MMTNGDTVTDTATPKPSKWDRLMAFLDSLGSTDEAEIDADVDSSEAVADAEGVGDSVEVADGAVADGTETEADADAEAQEHADGEADAETIPGAVEPDEAADADLRAKLGEQAATIETYRNMLAAQGLDPLTVDAISEVDDTPSEDERVAAFDEDYAVQEAKLAEIKMES